MKTPRKTEYLYQTTPVGELWIRAYHSHRDDINRDLANESYEQLLTFCSGVPVTITEVVAGFQRRIPPPLTPHKFQTQKLFDSIVDNLEILFRQLLDHGWIARMESKL
jgi:hypothetical protein